MKIIINTSNLYVGGGVQVALSFINELRSMANLAEVHIFTSVIIDQQLDKSSFPGNIHFYLIEMSPASLKTRRKIVRKLDELERQIEPDVVFSVFGPTYWTPRARHLMGFALGWTINPQSVAYDALPFLERMKMRLRSVYLLHHTRKNADYYVIETEDARQKLSQIAGIDEEKIFVVGNTHNSLYNEDGFKYFPLPEKGEDEFRLITVSHNHPNKNLKIISKVVPYLKNSNIKFFITIDKESYRQLFSGLENTVINLGPVRSEDCPSLYEQCDAMFLPTLLETFSASYPEAMKMKLPILTSDLSFARDLCGDAALYFDPLNPEEIAQKILTLATNENLRQKLIDRGVDRLASYETARSRAEKYLQLCEKVSTES